MKCIQYLFVVLMDNCSAHVFILYIFSSFTARAISRLSLFHPDTVYASNVPPNAPESAAYLQNSVSRESHDGVKL